MKEDLHNLLDKLSTDLLRQGYIKYPYQIAITEYKITDTHVKYDLFVTDIIEILNYMHPLLAGLDPTADFDEDLNYLLNMGQDLRDVPKYIYAGIHFENRKTLIKDRYEMLRRISVDKSVLESILRTCLKQGTSQGHRSLAALEETLSYVTKNKEGEIICRLERALFMVGYFPTYMCTFFRHVDADDDILKCVSVFCERARVNQIGNRIMDLMKKSSSVKLLENFTDLFPSDSYSDPGENPWNEVLEKLNEFLSVQKGHKAQGRRIPDLDSVIITLGSLIRKIELLSEHAKSNDHTEKIDKCREFLLTEKNNIGSAENLKKMNQLLIDI